MNKGKVNVPAASSAGLQLNPPPRDAAQLFDAEPPPRLRRGGGTDAAASGVTSGILVPALRATSAVLRHPHRDPSRPSTVIYFSCISEVDFLHVLGGGAVRPPAQGVLAMIYYITRHPLRPNITVIFYENSETGPALLPDVHRRSRPSSRVQRNGLGPESRGSEPPRDSYYSLSLSLLM